MARFPAATVRPTRGDENHVEDRLESAGARGRTRTLAHDGFGGLASAIMARAA
jgi:hypothetical protein